MAVSVGCGAGSAEKPGGESAPRLVHDLDRPATFLGSNTGGVSWVDVEDDGDLDLFVANGYDVSADSAMPQRDRLYLNDGTGRLVEDVDSALADAGGFSSGSTWGDYDGDGDPDVFVARQRGQDNRLFRNDGDGDFVAVEEGPMVSDGGHSYSASWVDVDGDGRLDLFVANGGLSHIDVNFLYRNLGGGSFDRVRDGAIVADSGSWGGAVWGDYDGDGDPDLFVANRRASGGLDRNGLFRNEGGWRFSRIVDGPVANDSLPAISAAWGDYDGDGDLDLYVGTLYGVANRLFRNEGDGTFVRIEKGPHVVDGGNTYAVNWADFDNDGDLDLFVANWGAASVLYENRGEGVFARMETGEIDDRIGYASSAAWGDYDDDGLLDLVQGNWPNGPGPTTVNFLYRNTGRVGSWLGIDPRTDSGACAVGTRLTLETTGGGGQVREVSASTGWRSQNACRAHFGLGDARIERLIVRWPGGVEDTIPGSRLGTNRTVRVGAGGDVRPVGARSGRTR